MAEESKRRLGRGLAALIGETGEPEVMDRARGPRRIPIESISRNPRNPRVSFDAADLADLTASVKDRGILQPLIVRPSGPEHYELIAGERRWRAAQAAGLAEVPVVVREVDDKAALEIAIIENVQRADLNPLEEAGGYQKLLDDFQYTQDELAGVVGKSRSHVANTLRLLKLPEGVRLHLAEGRLTAGHARALVGRADAEALAERIVDAGLSVRDVERLVAEPQAASDSAPKRAEKDADTRAVEQRIAEALGLAVDLKAATNGSGKLVLKYRTLEQLDGFLSRIGA